ESGQAVDKIVPLARKPLSLEPGHWYPVRIDFAEGKATVQVNDVVIQTHHEILAMVKPAMNFLVFGDSISFRNLTVTQP
ncbi:MAG TPA: hypothetical protein VD994_17200, partial [Prosthecobacter sp.]|nr:hypothetical protein [Prosthecobacter sp.]